MRLGMKNDAKESAGPIGITSLVLSLTVAPVSFGIANVILSRISRNVAQDI
jgi:hypothetical protein